MKRGAEKKDKTERRLLGSALPVRKKNKRIGRDNSDGKEEGRKNEEMKGRMEVSKKDKRGEGQEKGYK